MEVATLDPSRTLDEDIDRGWDLVVTLKALRVEAKGMAIAA